jgi:hypothetical protein
MSPERVEAVSESDKHLSIAECRALLGDEATAMSDDEVLRLRDRTEALVHVLLPIVQKMIRDGVRIE